MTTTRISNCPLCGHHESQFHSIPKSNLYSEKMAEVSGETEDYLLNHFKNVICDSCGLIFKQEAFPAALIQTIFKDVVPDHPKGWDVMSGRFTPDNFFRELDLYEEAIRTNQTDQINRYRRALLSLIDSIYPHEPNASLKLTLSALIEELNCNSIRNYRDALFEVMKEPMPFKRFSGFSASVFWNYLEEKCGPIQEYDEIGCPLWGMLSLAKSKGVDARFVQRPELNYWGENCQRNNLHCVQWLHQTHQIPLVDFELKDNMPKRQMVGFFQYLDHLDNPIAFLNKIFQYYQSAAVILDGVDEPVYIQHTTGWTTGALNYIAARYDKKLFTDFEAINASGNRLYLFHS